MNNELYSQISDPDNIPRASASFVQTTLQDRLQNRINQLLDDEPTIAAVLERRGRLAADLKRRVDRLSARVDNAARLTALLRHNLVSLGRCLDQFIAADVSSVMRQLVCEVNANRDCVSRLRRRHMTGIANSEHNAGPTGLGADELD